MPGKVKVKILSGRNLPVMDRSSDTTDAYVEVKLGTTTFKTDVCRKSLNPQWNSEWYRFELDDAELQDEPLQIRIMDHDTYSANDAIGKVYIDLNPLLLPQSMGSNAKNSDSLSSITSSSGGSVMSGWFPVYDTMHGIRGEVNVIVKVDLFTDFNKFRQSSCGVQFFNSSVIPQGYTAQIIHGFVEELVVSDDPEYQWIEKIRTPRASNEARQTTFFKLSGEVQRKIGLKVLELGGNCVIGYHQVFDLEGESGIVVRGIGTAVTLARTQDTPQAPGSAPPQISLPPYAAPAPAPPTPLPHDDQRTPSFLSLPKFNLSRLSPTRNILSPLSRLSPRLKRKSTPTPHLDIAKAKPRGSVQSSPGNFSTHGNLDSSDVSAPCEPDFNYSMNILLQQEDGRKNSPKKNRLMQAISSIPRSSRKIYKKFSSADDNISIASKLSLENSDALLSGVLESVEIVNGVSVDDSFELSTSSSSSSSSSSTSSSSSAPPTFEPLIYNYEQSSEPVVDLSNIKHFPRRNSDYSDEVNCILSEKYAGSSIQSISEKREQEERARRRADRESDEELHRKLNYSERVVCRPKIDIREDTMPNVNPSRHSQQRNMEVIGSTIDGQLRDQETSQALSDQGSPKTRKVSMFEGNLLEPNRDSASGRRYSDASQLSPHSSPQNGMTRRHSSSDIRDNDTWVSFESVYGRRLSDLPDLVTVKMSEKKRGPSTAKHETPNPKLNEKQDSNTKITNTTNSAETVPSEAANRGRGINDSKGSVEQRNCSVEIKVDEVENNSTSKEDSNGDFAQQITDSFSFLDSRGTPPMSEMDRVDCEDEKTSEKEKSAVINKDSRPYLSNVKNRIAYKETIFTPRSELMLTVTEPSFDSNSSRQVSFDTDTSHDDLVLESSKEEIEFTGSHFLDLKPKLSKSYENLSSLVDEDLSPERSFSLTNCSDEVTREKKIEDLSKKIYELESYPGPPPLKTNFYDPVFGRPLEKLSEESESKSPSFSDEDNKELVGPDEKSPDDVRDSNDQNVSDNGDSSSTKGGQKLSDQSTNIRERNNAQRYGGLNNRLSNNQGSGGDEGDDNPDRDPRPVPQDKQSDEDQDEEEDGEKTPPLSRMSPVVFGDENSNVVNFLSYNVTKSGSLIGLDRFNDSDSRFQMSLMNMNNVSRSNPNLSSDTKVRLTPRDKSRSMFDLVIVSSDPDKSSLGSRRSSVKKSGKMFRRRESKSAENVSRTPSDKRLPKQPVLSDENLQDSGSAPAQPPVRKDSVFARRKISLTNDLNRRESKSNGNLTESVENLASTLLTRRGSVNLKRNNSITRKTSVTGESPFKKGNKALQEHESYENVAGTVLMRRDSVKRMPEGRLKKQNSLNKELDRKQSQSSENIRPTYRDPFGDHLMSRSSSITSVSEYRETLRKLLKSQESIEEINESDPTLNRTNGDRKLESKSLVDITEQLEGDESVNKSESNIHKMIAVPKPTSILKNKIDFVPIPTDLTNQKKNNNQSKARNFFGEDIDLNSIESDAKYKHESSPSNVHYSRIMANREDPLESRYSHIIANRIIVKPKQPVPDTKIQNGKDLQKRCPPPAQPHLKSNDYLVQKDFRTPARLQNIDYIKHREDSVDSTIVSEEIINSPLQFTDFSHNDPVMKKLLSDSKKKAENEIDLVLGESTLQDEDLIEFVTKFIDAEIKANLLQRYEEGEKPLAVSVPSIESVSLKTQNFTAKFIEVERDACETQRIKGQNKKKKSVLIIKSTEPNFNTMENTFIIGTSPDEAHVTDKLIQEEDIEQSTTQHLRLSNTPQYSDSMEEETSQQSTAEFLERERVYSAFQQPHLVLVKKLGDKTSHVPICDGLKTESKIKDELEKTIKFLQTEREFSSLQMQAIVKLVRKSIESIDSIRIENEILKRALTFTQNFIENEKKFVAKDSVDLCVPSYSPNERSASKPKPQQKQIPSNEEKEERSSIPGSASKHGSQKKKSPSIEKEKRSPTKKKCPTQEEIDMILKRQSYDFALSKMNMTGVIPNINSYKTRQPSRDEETPYQVSLNERSEPNYGYIISQSSLNKHTYQQSPIKQFKMERNRLSGEEVLIEENTKVSSEDECKLSEIKPDEIQAINSEGSKTMQNFLSNEETTTQVIDQSYLNSIPREKSVDISDKKEIKTDTSKESSVEKEIPKQLSHEIPSVIETQTTMTEISDSKDESSESFCRVDRPIEEDSIDETESTIVNFFSASMETIKSRHTGHSDDFSDFNESVESGPAETCDTLPDHSKQTEPVATNPPSQSVRDEMVQETCDEEAQEHDTEMSENSTDKNSDEISPPIDNLEPKEIVLEVSAREPEPEDLYEHTLASNNSFNESVARNVDMIDNNLSPKSSASEVLSDSTIDNQLNECRNCRHSKIDSLDFFSDEDLKSSIDQTSNENTVDEQLETLKAEKQEADGSPERNVPHEATNLELQLEICEYENEEQMILEDKSDDKSPDLVVTQETSANVDIESLTPVAAPRTKKKKKKKHHASKENLNASAETQADEIDKSDMTVLTEQKNEISSTSAENNFEKTNEEGTDGVVLQHPLTCDEHFQVSVESQEDSDSKSKPKKKRKRRLTITKATKEEPIQSSQIDKNETVEAQDQANESQKETVGLEKKRNESEREKLEEVKYLIKEEVQQDNLEQCPNDEPESKTTETTPANTTGESKTLKKKKVKLTRHTTQALSDILKPEIIVDASHVDTPFPVPPPENFSDVSQPEILAEVTEPADSCTSENEPGLCPEICDLPGHEVDDCYRLDEVCESIVDEESSNENEGDALPCETCTADAVDVCPKEYAVSNEALINRGSDTCPSEQLVEASPSDSVPDETCSDASAIGLCLSAPRNVLSRELQREQKVLLQGARRVDINTGLDVINSRLGVINQEISTIAHVLSNINDEIRHGGSTVVLDVPLDVSERERIQTGRRGTASLPNVLDRAFCCQSGACHLDSNETFKSLGAVVLKGFSAKEARLVNQAPPAGSGHSEGETLFEKETGLINQGLSSLGVNAVQPTTPSIGSVVLDDVSSFVSVNNTSANRVTNATDAGPLTPLVCDANLAPSPSHVPASVLRVPPEDVNGSYDATGPGAGVSTSSNLGISAAITRRSSESDLSITPKGNSLAGSGGSSGGFGGARIYSGPPRSAAMFKENLDMLEYPFLTMSKYPPGFILRVGGTVRANSVKLLERMTNLEEPESRDAWWTELRLEVRSHARALACNVVLGYSEHTAICDDVCVLSASGTAAVINVCLGGSLHAAGAEVADKFSKLGQNGAVSDSPLSNLIEHKADNVRQPMFRPRDNLEMPLLPCRFCHVPYNEASVPFKVNLVKCAVCKKGKVPDLIFATIEPPDNVPITGGSCFIQAFVSRSKRDCKGELNAKEISDGLPFLEYELHRQLMNKLTVKGMNALFGLKVQKCIGERTLAAYATATAAYLSPLPPPALPKVTAGDAWKDGNTIAEMQRMLQDCVQENRDFFRLRRCSDGDRLLVSDSDESEEEVLPDIDLNAGGKDTCILEMDDAEDISVVSQLIDPHPPRGFHVSSIETLPGLDQLEVVKNLQMFTQVWRSRVPSTSTVNKHFQRLLQTMYYKLRRMTPCAIAKLSFHIDIPEPEEVQLSVVGMALGLGEVDKSVKSYRRRLLSCHSKDTAKDDGATDLIFRLDEDQNEAGSPAPHNRTPEDKTPSTMKPSLPPSRSPDPLSSTRPPLGQSRGAPQAQDRGPSLEDKDGKTSTLFTSHTPPKEHYGVDITPLSYIAGGRIERYLGNLNFFFIRESNCIRESGGLSGFVHSFVTEVLTILRAHVTALGGNAMVSYTMTHCILLNNAGKNQGQCLINVGGDVVFVSYPSQGSEDRD